MGWNGGCELKLIEIWRDDMKNCDVKKDKEEKRRQVEPLIHCALGYMKDLKVSIDYIRL